MRIRLTLLDGEPNLSKPRTVQCVVLCYTLEASASEVLHALCMLSVEGDLCSTCLVGALGASSAARQSCRPCSHWNPMLHVAMKALTLKTSMRTGIRLTCVILLQVFAWAEIFQGGHSGFGQVEVELTVACPSLLISPLTSISCPCPSLPLDALYSSVFQVDLCQDSSHSCGVPHP